MHDIIYSLALAATLVTPLGTIAESVNDEQFVQIPISDYVILTNKIYSMWSYANSTEQGRSRLHGKRISRTVDAESKVIVYEYADGYKYIDQMKPHEVRQFVPQTNTTTTTVIKRTKPNGMSDEQWEFVRKRSDTISAQKPRSVNAVFGPGGKVKSVTEAK